MRHGREAKERPEEDGAEGVLDVHPWDEIPEVEKIGALREEAGDGAVGGGRGIGGRRGHDAREEGPGMVGREGRIDRKSTRLNSSHSGESRMPSSA